MRLVASDFIFPVLTKALSNNSIKRDYHLVSLNIIKKMNTFFLTTASSKYPTDADILDQKFRDAVYMHAYSLKNKGPYTKNMRLMVDQDPSLRFSWGRP